MDNNLEGVWRSITALENSMKEQVSSLKHQLTQLSGVPVDIATLKQSSGHMDQNLTRIQDTLDDTRDTFKDELENVRTKVEKNDDTAIERFDSLAKSLQSVADRIETKFGTKIDEIKKELNVLVSDYDKRIAAMKAVAAAISIAFTLLQGVVGLAISSYVTGWKTRVEESEAAVKDIRRTQATQESLIKELQQESLSRPK